MRQIHSPNCLILLSLSSCLLVACQAPTDTVTSSPEPIRAKKLNETSGPRASSTSIDRTAVTGAVPPGASDGSSLSMEAAVRRALGWHPAVDEANGHIYQSEERIRAAQAGYYPKINAGVNSGYQSTNRDGWRPKLEVSGSQMLYDFGKVSSSVDAESAGKKINSARLLLTVDNLVRDTANAVVEVQRYRELSRLSQAQVEGVKTIAGLVKERSDQGASTMSDKVQADARVESALATQWQYQSEANRWQVALASLVGGSPTSVNPKEGEPKWLANACNMEAPDWTEVPTMLEAQAQKEEAIAQLAASKAEAFPTISLEAATGYDLNSGRDLRTGNDRQPEYSVGVNVSSSIYNGGQTSARKRAAAYALQSSEAAISTARLDIQRNLLESRSQIGTLSRLLSSLQSRAEMMVKTRDLYREQYLSLGTRTLLDLLNAEQELHDSRFQMANTVHDLRRLRISCLYSSGKARESFDINPAMLRGGVITQ